MAFRGITQDDRNLHDKLKAEMESLLIKHRLVFGDNNHIEVVRLLRKLDDKMPIKEQSSIMSSIIYYLKK
jgi:hypothetical protein